jgi:sorbitol/mannitol transport system substrate-binding protein
MNQGKAAIWCDATSAAELVSDPALSQVADKIGYAYFPRQESLGNWLWNWAFAIAANTDAKDAASPSSGGPPRRSTRPGVEPAWLGLGPDRRPPVHVRQPSYLEFAGDFSDIVLTGDRRGQPQPPTVEPVPYTGGQFVRDPEFQQLGDDVSREFAAAIVGEQSIDDAIAAADELANTMAIDAGYQS